MQDDAGREAKLIINDAKQTADMIVRDARDSLKNIYTEISDLKKIRLQFENNVRALVQSHETMLNQGHQIMPNPEIPDAIQRRAFADEEQQIAANVSDAVKNSLANQPEA